MKNLLVLVVVGVLIYMVFMQKPATPTSPPYNPPPPTSGGNQGTNQQDASQGLVQSFINLISGFFTAVSDNQSDRN